MKLIRKINSLEIANLEIKLEKLAYINPHSCTSTQTMASVKSGMKRKADEDGTTEYETSHLYKIV